MRHRRSIVRTIRWGCVFLLMVGVGSGFADDAYFTARPFSSISTPQIEAPSREPRSSLLPGPTDPDEIGAFLDSLIPAQLAEYHIAGAAVVVVRNGSILHSRGYGWADIERGIPVDPATTLFRIGSVTKLFTWTAVMQLRDAALLDLDADVNEYLDFKIPATFPAPITLRHILTHTTGFEDRPFGLFAPRVHTARGEYLRMNLPARVRPPGHEVAYSNYATALAGYIIERRTGLSWEGYVEQHILQHLGTEFATTRQPLPRHLEPHLSRGYTFDDGRFLAQGFDWVANPLGPAGSISATAEAMAAFMIGHLQLGQYGGNRILDEASAREMHSRAFGVDPRINGFALGFYERSSHGLRIIGHDGGTQHFFTDLTLIPSEQLGIYVSYNSAGGAALTGRRFRKAVLDHYYPFEPTVPGPPAPEWDSRSKDFVGSYRTVRRAYTTFEKLGQSLQDVTVTSVGPGEIIVRTPFMTERFHEVEPAYFESTDGFLRAAIMERAGGVPHLYLSTVASSPFVKVGFQESIGFHLVLLVAALLLFLTTAVVLSIRLVRTAGRPRATGLRPVERGVTVAGIASAALGLSFVLLLGVVVSDPDAIVTGRIGSPLRIAFALPILSLPLAFVVCLGAAFAFRQRWWGGWARLHFILFAFATVSFLLQLRYWNLLGW